MAGRRLKDVMGLLTLQLGEERFHPCEDASLRFSLSRKVYESGGYYRRRGLTKFYFTVRTAPEGIYYSAKERKREH